MGAWLLLSRNFWLEPAEQAKKIPSRAKNARLSGSRVYSHDLTARHKTWNYVLKSSMHKLSAGGIEVHFDICFFAVHSILHYISWNLKNYEGQIIYISHHSRLKPMTHLRETRTRNSCELTRSCEKLVRVSYWLAARYFSREFLASNRACSISCKFLMRVLVRVSRTSFSCVCHGLYTSKCTCEWELSDGSW